MNESSVEHVDRALRGGTRHVIAAQIASQLVSLAVLAVMFRLVKPAEFGILGIIAPVLMLLRMLSTEGLRVATVQAKDPSQGQLTDLFRWYLYHGLAAALVTAVAAPLLALITGAAQVTAVGLALAVTPLLFSAGAMHQALLERKLRFGRLALVRWIALVAGGATGIGTALAGGGVWALVAAQYAELILLTSLCWKFEPWRPSRGGRRQSIRPMLRLGGLYSAGGLLMFVAQNFDKVLLAILLGGTAQGRALLGMYTQMFNLMMRPVALITSPMNSLLLPALARSAAGTESFAAIVQSFYRSLAVILFPCGVGLMIVAPEVVTLLTGEGWEEAGPMLQGLALSIVALGLMQIAPSLFAAAGRTDRFLLGSIVVAIVMVQGVLVGYWLGGYFFGAAAIGVAWSISIVTVVVLVVPYTIYCLATTGVRATSVLATLIRPLVYASVMGLCVWMLRRTLIESEGLPSNAVLGICIAAGAGIYGLLARGEIRRSVGPLLRGEKSTPTGRP